MTLEEAERLEDLAAARGSTLSDLIRTLPDILGPDGPRGGRPADNDEGPTAPGAAKVVPLRTTEGAVSELREVIEGLDDAQAETLVTSIRRWRDSPTPPVSVDSARGTNWRRVAA